MKRKLLNSKEFVWILLGFLLLVITGVMFCLCAILVIVECPIELTLGVAFGVTFYVFGGYLLEWGVDVIRREEKKEKDEKNNIKV